MSKIGFPAALPIFPAAVFRGLSILTLVTLIILLEGLNEPRDPAFDEAGNLFIAETGTGRILKVRGDF